MADNTEYKEQLVSTDAEIPAPDDLIARGDYVASSIKVTAGEYKRGMLLMSGSDGFVPATADGIASAEACILCDGVTVPEGQYAESAGYFRGTFNGYAVILGYETAEDDHTALIEALRVPLRKQGIFLI